MKFLLKTAFYTVLGLLILFGLNTVYTRWQDRSIDISEQVTWAGRMAKDGVEQVKGFMEDRGVTIIQPGRGSEMPESTSAGERQLSTSEEAAHADAVEDRSSQDRVRHVHSRVADNISCLMKAQGTLMKQTGDGL